MAWNFERVAGPFKGATGGVAWDGSSLYFSAVDEDRVLRLHPDRNTVEEHRRWTYRANGLAVGPGGELYAGQEGGRRVVQYLPEGITTPTALQLDGRYHNFPCDLAVDSKGRVWFSDPYNPVPAFGPQMYPLLEHQSVLRMERDRSGWKLERMTFDTAAPRAIALSADEQTLYVSDGDAKSRVRELRAYPVRADGTLGQATVLHTFGSDYRGAHRGAEGLCVDSEATCSRARAGKRAVRDRCFTSFRLRAQSWNRISCPAISRCASPSGAKTCRTFTSPRPKDRCTAREAPAAAA